MARGTTLIAATLALAMACGLASGEDVLVTTKNKRYEGQVIEMTASKITIKTTLHGFETTLTFARSEVASLDLDDIEPAPEGAEGEAENDPMQRFTADQLRKVGEDKTTPREVVKREGIPLYMEIPIKGGFGEEVYPKGIAESLKWAHENGVTDVIFRINSPGGEVWAALRIVELMNEYREGLRYHALIESSISAAIWPTFTCDTISMAPRSDVGGAVVYSHDANTGSFEVNKKFNSILMAKLATQAEESGHNPQVVRAMMITDQALYAIPMGDGTYHLTGEKPLSGVEGKDYVTLDDTKSILTLTANEAEKYGIATKLMDDKADSLRDALGYAEWDDAGGKGVELTEHWADECRDIRSDLLSSQASISAGWARYGAEKYIRGAIRALEQLKKDMIEYDKIARKASDGYELGPFAEELSSSWEGKFTREWVDRTIKEYRTKLLYGP
ncbi:MAG: hypothetical protein R3B57_01795 [Phycisphaerales bacterium]